VSAKGGQKDWFLGVFFYENFQQTYHPGEQVIWQPIH